MNYRDILEVRDQAKKDIETADLAVRQAVDLIAGRLRAADVYTGDLVRLKAELRDFNAVTREWKKPS